MTEEERLERRRSNNRASYQKNRERVLAKHREWRRNNPEKMRALNADWYRKNHEKALAVRAKYRSENRETLRLAIRSWYQKNRRLVLDKARLLRTGCTPDEYDGLLKIQSGVCAICSKPPGKYALHADHCHSTNRVRGLLCHKCNTMLGLISDDIAVLKSAILYLTET